MTVGAIQQQNQLSGGSSGSGTIVKPGDTLSEIAAAMASAFRR